MFSINDRVRVVNYNSSFFGQEGIVLHISSRGNPQVQLDNSEYLDLFFYLNEVEKVAASNDAVSC